MRRKIVSVALVGFVGVGVLAWVPEAFAQRGARPAPRPVETPRYTPPVTPRYEPPKTTEYPSPKIPGFEPIDPVGRSGFQLPRETPGLGRSSTGYEVPSWATSEYRLEQRRSDSRRAADNFLSEALNHPTTRSKLPDVSLSPAEVQSRIQGIDGYRTLLEATRTPGAVSTADLHAAFKRIDEAGLSTNATNQLRLDTATKLFLEGRTATARSLLAERRSADERGFAGLFTDKSVSQRQAAELLSDLKASVLGEGNITGPATGHAFADANARLPEGVRSLVPAEKLVGPRQLTVDPAGKAFHFEAGLQARIVELAKGEAHAEALKLSPVNGPALRETLAASVKAELPQAVIQVDLSPLPRTAEKDAKSRDSGEDD